MCKDKLNCINGDYKRIYDYHKGTCHNTSYQHLSMEKHNKFNLPKQFNDDCHDVIQTFQGEKNINFSIYVVDLNAQGDGIYTTKQKTTRRPFFVQSFCFLIQKLLGEDNVQGQLGCLTCEHMHQPWNHYNKSWLFKRFNLIKMYALTKRMFVFTKDMGHVTCD